VTAELVAAASDRRQAPVTDRMFDIDFIGPGVEAFEFTLG
jgi:hypothetical protein